MKKIDISKCLRYAAVGGAIFFLCAYLRGLLETEGLKALFGVLSDCLIVPGTLFSGIAAISWIGSFGTFDMLGYGVKSFFVFLPRSTSYHKFDNFYDYKKSKDEKGRKWFKEMLITGAAFFALGAICLGVYGLL